MQKHDRRAVARGGYMRPQAAGVNELVLDACYVRDVGAHRDGKLPAGRRTSSRSVELGMQVQLVRDLADVVGLVVHHRR